METDVLLDLVQRFPGRDKVQLLRLLTRRISASITTRDVNRHLYRLERDGKLEWRQGTGNQRLWYLASTQSEAIQKLPGSPTDITMSPELHAWQWRALRAWDANQCRGVVEAITGAGKTRLALAAMARHLALGGKVAVVVPTVPLVDQWLGEINQRLTPHLYGLKLGVLGNGRHDWLPHCDVLVAIVNSGHTYYMLDPEAGEGGLLIADECHHYGAKSWQAVLQDAFQFRLGLTATYEREDNGIEQFLDPYFGGICYQLGYEEALADEIISPFKVAFIGAPFTRCEREDYEKQSERVKKLRRDLIYIHGVSPEPFGQFMMEVQQLKHAEAGRASKCAGMFLSAFTKRRAVTARAQGKQLRLEQLAPAVRHAERCILFSQTREAAQGAISTLDRQGVRGQVLDSTMDLDERRMVFAEFEMGEHEIVAAPKLLDEGVDVPSADLAVILAASRSRRQMIQRMGRVLRKKQPEAVARLAVLFVEGTFEDPCHGAHEDFMDLILPVAQDVQIFDSQARSEDMVAYLNNQ